MKINKFKIRLCGIELILTLSILFVFFNPIKLLSFTPSQIELICAYLDNNDNDKNSKESNASAINKNYVNNSDEGENNYIPMRQFLIADKQRYTISGLPPLIETKIKLLPTIILGTTLTGIFIVQNAMQQNTIWKRVGPFWIAEDAKYSAYLDKCGHFYGAYMSSYLLGECLFETGFSWDDGSLIAGILGMSYSTYVEILDGFSKDWGFSPTDWYGDVLGGAFYISQHYIPFLQNFTPKFMYVNPSWHKIAGRTDAESFIDNYSTQTFYMSANVHNLLPDNLKDYWPKWLEIGLGYAVYNMSSGTTNTNAELIYDEPYWGKVYGNRKILLSLDYNLIELLPDGPDFWNWFKQGLNYFKLPSPTLEIGFHHNTKFYLIYPFILNFGNFHL